MTSCYARLLALVALGMLMASGQAFAQTDYDTDDDNYIDVSGHAQLNAIRYDFNGDGVVANTDTANHNAAFPNRATGMGCPGTCVGYELTANIDLDTDGDGNADSADAYWNSGAGWDPIASANSAGNRYTGDFKGNRYTIDNLFINRNSTNNIGLFGSIHTTSRIETAGVTNANVTGRDHTGILVGINYGEVVACYTTGAVSGHKNTGGLVGRLESLPISSSYSTASVSGTSGIGGLVGYALGVGSSITNSYSIGSVSGTSNVGGLLGSGASSNVSASYLEHLNQRTNQ